MALKDEPKPISFKSICDELATMHGSKNGRYKDSPLNILPVPYWTAQLSVKAVRADQDVEDTDRMDDLLDTAVYAIMVILKMRGGTI